MAAPFEPAASATYRPTFIVGLNDVIGSWKTAPANRVDGQDPAGHVELPAEVHEVPTMDLLEEHDRDPLSRHAATSVTIRSTRLAKPGMCGIPDSAGGRKPACCTSMTISAGLPMISSPIWPSCGRNGRSPGDACVSRAFVPP